ncbi:MAG: PhnA domain-containing protein [Rhodospirillales bacterium]|nr:PhnA domain-containing protein [Rhodospirillales bacterium]
MSVEADLQARSQSKCELCNSADGLAVYQVPPAADGTAETSVLVCPACLTGINDGDGADATHWRCLGESMWNEAPAVQVVAWRLLRRMRDQTWAQELLDMLYLDDQTQAWAEAGAETDTNASTSHTDANGAQLKAGDTVTLIKDLNVKGGGFTAKRGTAVRSISLVADNAGQIEGRINGQQIVLLTEFVKKSG